MVYKGMVECLNRMVVEHADGLTWWTDVVD